VPTPPEPSSRNEIASIDTEVATEARVYDYLLGGVTNFPVDRETAERQGEAVGGIQNAQSGVRANRVFLGEAVRRLAAAGVRQFLDIGSGIPTEENVHEVAQRLAPESRVVYVDHDPVVLAHAHELLRSTDDGAADYIQADMRQPGPILEHAAATLDLTRPVALTLVSMLHFFSDDEDPQGLVRQLVDALPSGSYLVLSHLTGDFAPEAMAALADAPGDQASYTFIPRDQAGVAAFLTGLELDEHGVASMAEWLPADTDPTLLQSAAMFYYCAIGRKP
jgi:SAM-dependent methyltransferase